MTDQFTSTVAGVQIALPALSIAPVVPMSPLAVSAVPSACPGCAQTIPATAEFCAYCGANQTKARAEIDADPQAELDAPSFGIITVPTTDAPGPDALRAAVVEADVRTAADNAQAAHDDEDEEGRLDPLYLKGLDTADDLARPRRCRLSPTWHIWGAPTTPRCAVNQCERYTGKVTLTRNKDTGVYRATHTLPDECWPARIFDPFAPQTAGLSAPR